MVKKIQAWLISDLAKRFVSIEFPEFQREPNIWSLKAKQRLIDSILRQCDIGSLYFYQDGESEGAIDCIDGRQRINAILSFLGENPGDAEHDGFVYQLLNEVYDEPKGDSRFHRLNGKTFKDMRAVADDGDEEAIAAVQSFLNYQVTAVLLSGATRSEEFNLQFTRLNLGVLVNAGEKLNAMVGDMRDFCFANPTVGQHRFLRELGIPTRRYAREQVAAQVLAQAFSMATSREFTKTRHVDLQKFFKTYSDLNRQEFETERETVEDVKKTLDALSRVIEDTPAFLRSRALTVTIALMAWSRKVSEDDKKMGKCIEFCTIFVGRLRWQVAQGLDVKEYYRYLIDFQRDVTQASVERKAVERRFRVLGEEFDRWTRSGMLRGDDEYRNETDLEPEMA